MLACCLGVPSPTPAGGRSVTAACEAPSHKLLPAHHLVCMFCFLHNAQQQCAACRALLQAGVLSQLLVSLEIGAQYLMHCRVGPGLYVARVSWFVFG
jgi:hypothetical protein